MLESLIDELTTAMEEKGVPVPEKKEMEDVSQSPMKHLRMLTLV